MKRTDVANHGTDTTPSTGRTALAKGVCDKRCSIFTTICNNAD